MSEISSGLEKLRTFLPRPPEGSTGFEALTYQDKLSIRNVLRSVRNSEDDFVDLLIQGNYSGLKPFINSTIFSAFSNSHLSAISNTKLAELRNNINQPDLEKALKSAFILIEYYKVVVNFPDFETLLKCFYLTAGRGRVKFSSVEKMIGDQLKSSTNNSELYSQSSRLAYLVSDIDSQLSPFFPQIHAIFRLAPDLLYNLKPIFLEAIAKKTEGFRARIDQTASKSITIPEIRPEDPEASSLTPLDTIHDPDKLDIIASQKRPAFGLAISRAFSNKPMQAELTERVAIHICKMAGWDLTAEQHATIAEPLFASSLNSSLTLGFLYLIRLANKEVAVETSAIIAKKTNKNNRLQQFVRTSNIKEAICLSAKQSSQEAKSLEDKLTKVLKNLGLTKLSVDCDELISDSTDG